MKDETLIQKAILDETISNSELRILVYIKLYGYKNTLQVSTDTNIERKLITSSLNHLLKEGYIKATEICDNTLHKLKCYKAGFVRE